MNELISILKNAAPAVATALAGPVGGLVVSKIADKLGVDADAGAIVQAISTNTEALAKVKELELEYFKTVVDDRKSAREMQVATNSYFVPSLGFFIVASFIGVIVATLIGWATADSVLAGTLIGYLSGKAEQVISFYFGSSHGSQAKDQLLYNSEPKK